MEKNKVHNFRQTQSLRYDENPLAVRALFHERESAGAQLDHASIRKLWQTDHHDVADHLRRLDSDTLALRFFSHIGPSYVAQYVKTLFDGHIIIYGAFIDGVLRGMAELHLLPPDHHPQAARTAEVALSVETGFQGDGLGTALMHKLICAARNRDVRRITCTCLPGNQAMAALAAKFGAELHIAEGESMGEINPGTSQPFGMMAEMLGDARDVMVQMQLSCWQLFYPPGPREDEAASGPGSSRQAAGP